MTKPKSYTITYYDLLDALAYLGKKYNFDARDFYKVQEAKEKISTDSLATVKQHFGNCSFYNQAPSDYTPEQIEQRAMFYALCQKAHGALPDNLDFWNDILCDKYEISNGCHITMEEENGDFESDTPEYQKILNWILEEFAEGEEGKRTVNFLVSW